MTEQYLFVSSVACLFATNLLLDWYLLQDRKYSTERTLINLFATVVGLSGTLFLD